MTVVVRTEEVLLLVGVQILVHGNGPDIFHGVLVIHGEVPVVVVLQSIPHILYLVTVLNGFLPVRLTAIHLGVEHELRKHKGSHRIGDTTVVVAWLLTVTPIQIRTCVLQLLHYEREDFSTGRLFHLLHGNG